MKQTILSIVLIAAVAAAGYFTYRIFSGGPGGGAAGAGVPQGIDETQLLAYRQIENLKPDLSIFTDPFYKSLFSPQEAYQGGANVASSTIVGRQNPFVPF